MPTDGRALTAPVRIAVIGTGNIGATLGSRWNDAGHDVVYAARTARPDGPGGRPVIEVADAVDGADVIVLAIPGPAAADLLADIGARLSGKVLVDATNNLRASAANAHEAAAASAPDAHYVRAFNTLGWENFADPPADADLFYAADESARETAEALIAAVGLRPQYVGGAGAAGTVDALLGLWFALVQQRGGKRKLAFRVVD